MIGGNLIPTGSQFKEEKLQMLKESILQRANIMCAQLINDGKVYFSNSADYWDFAIPAPKAKTYSATNGFLKIVGETLSDYWNANSMDCDTYLIGSDIVGKILQDSALHQTMYNLGLSNVGRDLTVAEQKLVIGTFMGQNLQQTGRTFNEKGVSIIPGNHIKLLNTQKLRQGFSGIEVIDTVTKTPDVVIMDYYADVTVESEIDAYATFFMKSGFFPLVEDPASIQTYAISFA
jgi:hypothetical protein